MIRFSIGAQRLASGLITGAVLLFLAATPSHAAAKIQRLVSPGGIEAWFAASCEDFGPARFSGPELKITTRSAACSSGTAAVTAAASGRVTSMR